MLYYKNFSLGLSLAAKNILRSSTLFFLDFLNSRVSSRRATRHGPTGAAGELFELFEEIHMLIFYVMLAYILLITMLLFQARKTRDKFHDHESQTLYERLSAPTDTNQSYDPSFAEYRLHRTEFYHPFDRRLARTDLKPASFDFADYLVHCMSDFLVELIEIPSSAFVLIFLLLLVCRQMLYTDLDTQMWFLALANWIIFALLAFCLSVAKGIYYQLLPRHAKSGRREDVAAEEEKNEKGETKKPAYLESEESVGTGVAESGNPHERLFPMAKKGPSLLSSLLQLCLFLQAVYVAIFCSSILESILEGAPIVLAVLAQLMPVLLSLGLMWPALLYYFTICTNIGMMKNGEAIAETVKEVEAKQFEQYKSLLEELEMKALVFSIKKMGEEEYKKWRELKVKFW